MPEPPWPTPGALLERGRYRLLAEHGRDDRCAARLWRGLDLILERDVALTLFIADPEDHDAKQRMQSAVHRARRSARLVSPGAAQVLDVLDPITGPGGTVAAVIAEWTPGSDLTEVVRDGPPDPSVAAGLLAPLADAVDTAHRAGLVLGCDQPQRIRVTPHGRARLAFPGAAPALRTEDDIRGLGALLYLLLTGHWPLPHNAGALLPAAPVRANGSVANPNSLRPGAPVELSTLALRCLGGGTATGVHTGAAVQRVLESHMADGEQEPDPSAEMTNSDALGLDRETRARRLRLGVSVTALVGAALLILGYAGIQVASVFADHPADPLVVGSDPTAEPNQQPVEPPGSAPVVDEPSIVRVVDVSVYDISRVGSPDNPEDADQVIDGDPETAWSTDSYFQQFPAYKEGLGVMLAFERPITVSAVLVTSSSPGTVIEVRAAPEPGADLDETTLVGTETLYGADTEIPVRAESPTRHLLLWITRLSEQGDRIQSGISEVEVHQRQTN